MSKPVILAILMLALVSVAHVVLPVYTIVSPKIVETQKSFHFNNGYDNVEVHARRLDIFQFNRWFVKIEAEVVVNGTKISLDQVHIHYQNYMKFFSRQKQT